MPAQFPLCAKFSPHNLNPPNLRRTIVNSEVGVLFLGGLPLLCFLIALIVEENIVEFLDTQKTSTLDHDMTNMEVTRRRIP